MKEFVGNQIINYFERVLLGFCANPDKILNTRLKRLVLQKGDLRMAKCSCVNVFWDWDLCLFLGQKLLSDPLWIKKKNNSYCNRNENLGSYAIWDWKLPQWKGGSIVILSSRAGSGGRCTGWGEQLGHRPGDIRPSVAEGTLALSLWHVQPDHQWVDASLCCMFRKFFHDGDGQVWLNMI